MAIGSVQLFSQSISSLNDCCACFKISLIFKTKIKFKLISYLFFFLFENLIKLFGIAEDALQPLESLSNYKDNFYCFLFVVVNEKVKSTNGVT